MGQRYKDKEVQTLFLSGLSQVILDSIVVK